MKNIKRKEEGVSPVIATILMVAITVVLAATLYMMLPSGSETETTEAMSGRVNKNSNGWLIEIDSGSVSYDQDALRIYDTNTGAAWTNSTEVDSVSGGDVGDDGDTSGDWYYVFNDNDGNDNINGGDSILIVDSNHILEDEYQFRVSDTSLQLTLE